MSESKTFSGKLVNSLLAIDRWMRFDSPANHAGLSSRMLQLAKVKRVRVVRLEKALSEKWKEKF